MNLGLAVWRERDRRGWSQRLYADFCGLSSTYVCQIENNQRNVTMKTLEKLAAGFDLRPSSLLALAEQE